MTSFQICVHEVDEIFCQFGRDLLLGPVSKVETDMSFEDFAHQRVHSATYSGKQHELSATVFIGSQRTLHCVELAAHFSQSLQQLKLFPVLMGHGPPPVLDNTHP